MPYAREPAVEPKKPVAAGRGLLNLPTAPTDENPHV